MDTLGNRIKLARGKMSQDQFSNLLKVSKGSLGFYERDENLPNSAVILKICSETGVRIEWLLTGQGSMREESPAVAHSQQLECDVDLRMIPMVEACLSAGGGSLETSGDSDRSYAFRMDFLTRKGNPDAMVLMRVSGDSMEPEICNGDVVLLDQSQQRVRPGHIYAVGFEDAIYCKRVDMLPGQVVLKSANPAYPPVTIDVRGDLADAFRIIGKVLWSDREYI